MRYILTVEIKNVDEGATQRGPVQEALRVVRSAGDLRSAVEYGIQVLTLERNGLAQDAESEDDRHDKAAEMFPKVRQRLYELGPRGITSAQVDEAACEIVRLATGVRLAVDNGRVAS
jgi:hypothetical protein